MVDKKFPFPVDEPPTNADDEGAVKTTRNDETRPAFRTEEVPQNAAEVKQKPSSAEQSPSPPISSEQINTLTSSPVPSEAIVSEEQALEHPPSKSNVAKDEKKDGKPDISPAKKGFPKAIIFAILFLIIGVLVFLAVRQRLGNLGETLFGRKGEIVWWGFRDDGEIYKTLIEEYQKDNPNVRISYKRQSPIEYRERLTNALASGEGPDIFEIHNSWIPMFVSDLEQSPMERNEFSKSFYPIIVSDLTLAEDVLAAPLEFDALTLFVNEDVFASAAKIPPTTWDELRLLALELTQKDSDKVIIQSGAAVGITENIDHWQEIVALMMIQNGVDFTKELDDRVEDALEFYTSFSKKHGIWDNKLPPSTNAFALGKTAMYFAPTWRAYEITQISPNLKFRTVALPQLPKNEPDEPNFSYATYWVQAVWAKSANKDFAWDFLAFLTSEESLKEVNKRNKQLRGIERLYPRPDMNIIYRDHPILGSVMRLAYSAKSWYLADATNDGETGINTQVGNVFKDIMQTQKFSVSDLDTGVRKVLSQYLR